MKHKAHIKKGDEVVVISGNAKGHTGTVISVNARKQQVVVEGAKVMTKNLRKSEEHPDGGQIKQDGPIHISNVKKLG